MLKDAHNSRLVSGLFLKSNCATSWSILLQKPCGNTRAFASRGDHAAAGVSYCGPLPFINPRPRLYMQGARLARYQHRQNRNRRAPLPARKTQQTIYVAKVVDGHFIERQGTQALSRAAMLASRPTRNESLRWENNDNGEVQVFITRQRDLEGAAVIQVFLHPQAAQDHPRRGRQRGLADVQWPQLGRQDDRRAQRQIPSSIARRPRSHLLQYLKTLGQKRFIGFVLESDEKPPGRGAASGKKWQKKQTGASN